MPLLSIEQARIELQRFRPETYAICLGKIGRDLEAMGLVEWVPPVWGDAQNWRITEKGKRLAAEQDKEEGE